MNRILDLLAHCTYAGSYADSVYPASYWVDRTFKTIYRLEWFGENNAQYSIEQVPYIGF